MIQQGKDKTDVDKRVAQLQKSIVGSDLGDHEGFLMNELDTLE